MSKKPVTVNLYRYWFLFKLICNYLLILCRDVVVVVVVVVFYLRITSID